MSDCPALTLPPLLVGVLIGLMVLACLWTVRRTLRDGRRHQAWMRVRDEMYAEEHPDLYAARQARQAEEEARVAVYLAQQPTWWQRWTRRPS